MRLIDLLSKRPRVLLFGLISFHLCLALTWISRHSLPTGGRDEFFIVEVATEIGFRLVHGDFSSIAPFLFENAYYPPLVRLPGVLAVALGLGYDGIVVSGWSWLVVLLPVTYLLGRETTGWRFGGLTAVALLLASPGLTNCLHHYESNLGPMALCTLAFFLWVKSDDLTLRGPALAFGLVLGLGLLSDRLGVLPFAIIPVTVSLLLRRSRDSLSGLGVALVALVLSAGWWYLDFLPRFAGELLPQLLDGEISRSGAHLDADIPPITRALFYVVALPDTQAGLLTGCLSLVGLWFLWTGKGRFDRRLVLWLLAGLLLFSLPVKRQVYYTLPLLPLACVAAGVAIAQLRRLGSATGGGLVAGVLLLTQLPPVLSLAPHIVDHSPGLTTWLLLHQSPITEEHVGTKHPLYGAPENVGLDMGRVVDALSKAGLPSDSVVAVLSADQAQLTEHYQLVLARLERGTLDTYGLTTHPQTFLTRKKPVGAFLYVHRGGDDWPTRDQVVGAHESHDQWAPEFEGLISILEDWREGATRVGSQTLADGERLTIWLLAQ